MKVHKSIIQMQTQVLDSLEEISYNKYKGKNKTRQDEIVTDIRTVHFSELEDDVQGHINPDDFRQSIPRSDPV